MANYNILCVFDTKQFPANNATYNNPAGAGSYWTGAVFMITDANGTALSGGQASDALSLTVHSGDTITWLDTPIDQNLRYKSTTMKEYDILIYGMSTSTNWSSAFSAVTGSSRQAAVATITSNFNSMTAEPTFSVNTGPDNICTATALAVSTQQTVSYFLKIVVLDITDLDNPKPVGWYQIDPQITVKP